MSQRHRIEEVLAEHGSEWWDDHDCGIYADYVMENADLADAASIANALWATGANKPARNQPIHRGCRYQAVHDGDYLNECAACETWLTELGQKIIAALTPTETNRTPS